MTVFRVNAKGIISVYTMCVNRPLLNARMALHITAIDYVAHCTDGAAMEIAT